MSAALLVAFVFYGIAAFICVFSFFAGLIRYGDLWRDVDPDTWVMRWFCKKHNFIYAKLQKQSHPELYERD